MVRPRLIITPAPPAPAAGGQRLLTAQDVAVKLAISRRLAYQWMADGTIPTVDLPGRLRRCPEADLDVWIADQTRPGRA